MAGDLGTDSVPILGFGARSYDFFTIFYGVPFINRRHVSLIDLREGDRVLDVGCGTAWVLRRLYKRFGERVDLRGVEASVDMLEIAHRRLRGIRSISVQLERAEKLPYPDRAFDWVVSCLTTHHLPLEAKLRMIEEAHRVLRPGGRLLISDFGRPRHRLGRLASVLWRNHHYTPENMENVIQGMVERAGFEDLVVVSQGGVIDHLLARAEA